MSQSVLNQFQALQIWRSREIVGSRASACSNVNGGESMQPLKQYKRSRPPGGSPDNKENLNPSNSPANLKKSPLLFEYVNFVPEKLLILYFIFPVDLYSSYSAIAFSFCSSAKLAIDQSTRPWKKNKILEEIHANQSQQHNPTTSTKTTKSTKPASASTVTKTTLAEEQRMQQLNSLFSQIDDFTLEVADSTKYVLFLFVRFVTILLRFFRVYLLLPFVILWFCCSRS
jgi:hypothetical protein